MTPALAIAASPAAGVRILNQAIISYKDALGADQITTTNEVALVVQRVYAATLTGDRDLRVAPGGTVEFTHLLTNTGNGSDLFCLTIEPLGGSSAFSTARLIHDRNENGVIETSDAVLATGTGAVTAVINLDQDETATFIVEGVAPSGAALGDVYGVTLHARAQEETGACVTDSVTDSGADGDALAGTNNDRATVVDEAILQLRKSSTYLANGAGADDDQIAYTLTLTNSGLSAATSVTIEDAVPAGATFVSGSAAVASGSFSVAPAVSGTPPAELVSAQLATLASGGSASFTFTVDLDDALVSGDEIRNTATARGDLDASGGVDPATESVSSNIVVDTLAISRGLTLSDTATGAGAANDGGDDDSVVANDIQYVSNVGEGAVALFNLNAANTGDSRDLMEVSINSVGNFPAGTVFRFMRADGATPMLDADADGWMEFGPLDPGETRKIVVQARLPLGALAAPYDAVVRLRADAEPTLTDDATIHIQSIIPAAVDIAATSGAGFNDGGAVNREPAAVAALGVNVVAGDETFVASLFLANEGAATESYLFSAWSDMAATTPMGGLWRIEFSDNGARNLSHSAPLPGAGADQFELYVTAPINLAPGVYPLYVKVVGGASGATDILRIDVTVTAAQAALSLTPDGEGVVAPCSSVFYDHVLRNGGAAAINAELAILGQTTLGGSLLLPSSSAGGEPSAFKTDINFPVGAQVAVNSGGVWGTAAMVAPFGAAAAAIPLAPGDWTVVRVRVSAACDVPARALDVLTLKATASNGDSATAADTTTVAAGQLVLRKTGARDIGCAATNGGGLAGIATFQTGGLSAAPGDCVVWRVRAENIGVEPVCNVEITDGAPVFTRLRGTPIVSEKPAGASESCSVSNGDVTCAIGSTADINGDSINELFCLMPSESAEIRFGVEIE